MPNCYVSQDDCKSHLGKLMQRFRAERPSEYMMDEFIREAERMHEEIKKLELIIKHGLGPEDLVLIYESKNNAHNLQPSV